MSRLEVDPTNFKYSKHNQHTLLYPAAVFEPRSLLTAAGQVLFVPGCSGEQVRGDGQGIGAGDVSMNTPRRAVAVSWRGESRYCCGGRASR